MLSNRVELDESALPQCKSDLILGLLQGFAGVGEIYSLLMDSLEPKDISASIDCNHDIINGHDDVSSSRLQLAVLSHHDKSNFKQLSLKVCLNYDDVSLDVSHCSVMHAYIVAIFRDNQIKMQKRGFI